MKTYNKTLPILLCSLGLSLGAHATAILLPAEFDFGTGAGQVDVTDDSDWTITIANEGNANGQFNTLANSLQMTVGSQNDWSNVRATVATDLSVASLSSFSMSTTLTLTNLGNNNNDRYGFTFFGDGNTSLTALVQPRLGRIRFMDGFAGDFSENLGIVSGLSFNEGATYTLSLLGSFNIDGELDLTFSVDEVGGDELSGEISRTITTAQLGDFATGSEFGLAGRIRQNEDAQFSNLSIIPEPSTALFGLVGVLALLRRRRA